MRYISKYINEIMSSRLLTLIKSIAFLLENMTFPLNCLTFLQPIWRPYSSKYFVQSPKSISDILEKESYMLVSCKLIKMFSGFKSLYT